MLKLLLADIKMMFRNKQYAMWALIMPIMFTFIFGFFFGENASNGTIAIINKSDSETAATLEDTVRNSKLFTISDDIKNEASAKDKIAKSKLGAAIVLSENFGTMTKDSSSEIKVIKDPGNNTTNAVLDGFLGQFVTKATYQSAGITTPLFQVVSENTNNKELSYFDFVVAGILGMSLMNSSIIGVAIGMNKYKEDKILKRITTTPMKTWWFIAGEVLSRLVMNFLQISIILIVAKFVLHAHIYGNLFTIYLLAFTGAILFQLIGFVIASFVKTTQAAEGAATAITMPMMFLGGVFFPIDTLPHWLYSFVQYLPIAPFLRVMRSVVLEGNSMFANPMNIGLVGIWIIICLGLAIWKFRLADE